MAETKHPTLKRRRWKRFLFGGVGALLLSLLVYPVWFPWVLRPMAKQLGVQFEDYQRHGYARIELRGVQWTNATVSISAALVDLQMPHHWLWTRRSGLVGADPQVVAREWRVAEVDSQQPSAGGMDSTAELLDELRNLVPPLAKWAHWIVLTDGELNLMGNSHPIPKVTFQKGQLAVEAYESRAVVDITALSSSSLALLVSNQLATGHVQLSSDEDSNWTFDGDVNWQSNRFDLNGSFDRERWLPAVARLGTDSPIVPWASLGLGEISDLQGSVWATWTNASYSFEVNLTNRPAAPLAGPMEAISLQAGGSGDFKALELYHLNLSAPFLRATVDRPLTFDFGGSVEGLNATVNLWADLSQIEALPVEGQLSGFVSVQPTIRSPLRLSFSLAGADLAGAGLRTKSAALAGMLNWPVLQVTNLVAEFESGGKVVAGLEVEVGLPQTQPAAMRLQDAAPPGDAGLLAGWNLRHLHWRVDGVPPIALPESVQFESVHASGTAEGIWPGLTHTGHLETRGLKAGVFRSAVGQVDWEGQGRVLDRLGVRLENGTSTIEANGKGRVEQVPNGVRAGLEWEAFVLVTRAGRWALSQPFRFDLSQGTDGLAITLSPLDLRGPTGQLQARASIQWPSSGTGELAVDGLRSSDVGEFLVPDIPELLVPDADVSFAWDNGPLLFDLNAEAQWRKSGTSAWSIVGRARADGRAMELESLRVDLNAEPCIEVTGYLPLGVEPAQQWRVVESGSNEVSRFDVRVLKAGPLWNMIEDRAGVKFTAPTVKFQARGLFPDITGELFVNAGQVRLAKTNANPAILLPELDNVQMEMVVGLGGIELRRAEGQVLGQRIQSQANWELAARSWAEWWQAVRSPDWRQLKGSLRMENAQLSALSALAPGIIAPIGEAGLDLSLSTDLRVRGRLAITNGATRFLKPIGALRDIETDITLEGWNAKLNSFSATLGGRPVGLGGELSWRADGDREFNLRLNGRNLSLIRDPELFVRADLDLHLQKSFDEVARLSGEVQLQRSLLFRDFNSLIGFDRDQPEQRPPYFSVPQPPFGDWQIDVRVRGDRFLNVFSPAFKGEVSAGLQLLGTLREPIAVGAVTVDSGKILFPFGTLQVENGRVDLTREDPYRPRLDFQGEGQNYGYTITVDLRGPLDAPNLTFQSVPPLNAQQILLMLTAGEIPRSDFGYDATDKASKVGFYIGKEFVNRFIGNTSTTERLSLKSGENITNDGKPTYSIEYRFTDRWSAFGEYDRFQNVNSGLKFKVLSK